MMTKNQLINLKPADRKKWDADVAAKKKALEDKQEKQGACNELCALLPDGIHTYSNDSSKEATLYTITGLSELQVSLIARLLRESTPPKREAVHNDVTGFMQRKSGWSRG